MVVREGVGACSVVRHEEREELLLLEERRRPGRSGMGSGRTQAWRRAVLHAPHAHTELGSLPRLSKKLTAPDVRCRDPTKTRPLARLAPPRTPPPASSCTSSCP